MAVAYHFYHHFDTAPTAEAGIRSTYDGPPSACQWTTWS